MSDGWVKVYRKVQDNWLWHHRPFSYGQAWIDLVMIANYKEGYIYPRNVQIRIERGQVGYSILQLAARWGWGRTAVKTFLNRLESAHQIVQQNNKLSSVITIIKYEEYQETVQQTEQQPCNSRASTVQQPCTNKKEKKDKKEKKESLEASVDQDKPSRPTPAAKMPDEEWLASLKSNSAYEGISIEVLHGKMLAWCQLKGKKPTRARLLNWLNREEKPMTGKTTTRQTADDIRRQNHADARDFVESAARGEFSR